MSASGSRADLRSATNHQVRRLLSRHADSLLVKAGSGALTFGHPDSAGVPASFTQHTVVLPFNNVTR